MTRARSHRASHPTTRLAERAGRRTAVPRSAASSAANASDERRRRRRLRGSRPSIADLASVAGVAAGHVDGARPEFVTICGFHASSASSARARRGDVTRTPNGRGRCAHGGERRVEAIEVVVGPRDDGGVEAGASAAEPPAAAGSFRLAGRADAAAGPPGAHEHERSRAAARTA